MKKFWEVKAAANKTGDVYVYGSIASYKWNDTDVTAKSFKDDIDALGDIDTLNIYTNSPGGSVFVAQAIYSILKRHKAEKNAYVDGLAASAASFLIMAADKILIPSNATIMVHKPSSGAWGNATDLRKTADILDKVEEGMIEAYMSHVKITEDKLKELLDAETWLTAKEAVEYGFADELIEEKNVAACIDPAIMAQYKNVPDILQQETDKEKELRNQILKRAQEVRKKIEESGGC